MAGEGTEYFEDLLGGKTGVVESILLIGKTGMGKSTLVNGERLMHSAPIIIYTQSVPYTGSMIECIRYLPPFHRAGEQRQHSSLAFSLCEKRNFPLSFLFRKPSLSISVHF